jgi:hypothetical protein
MKQIALNQGRFAIVDDEDFERLSHHKWKCWYIKEGDRLSYVKAQVNKKNQYLHRLIMDACDGQIVDHINGDTLDNRKCNLRICTASDNSRNQRKRKSTLSKYKGLGKGRGRKKWQVQIMVNKKRVTAGFFTDEIEAAKAYDAAARQYYGEFAATNFEDKETQPA